MKVASAAWRSKSVERAIQYHRERLRVIDYRRYRGERDYWRVVTYHVNRIRGLERLLEDEEGCPY